MRFLNSDHKKVSTTCLQKEMTDRLQWKKKSRLVSDTLYTTLEVRLWKNV